MTSNDGDVALTDQKPNVSFQKANKQIAVQSNQTVIPKTPVTILPHQGTIGTKLKQTKNQVPGNPFMNNNGNDRNIQTNDNEVNNSRTTQNIDRFKDQS